MGETATMSRRHVRWLAPILLSSLVLAACGGSKSKQGASTDTTAPGGGAYVAQVASYELVAGQDNRFLTGLAGSGDGTVVSYGQIDLQFFYLGTRDKPIDPPAKRMTTTATFLPVPGQHLDLATAGPKAGNPSDGVGLYEAAAVQFDAPGFWGVTLSARLTSGKTASANVPFEVVAEPHLPFPGQAAPRTDNSVAGAEGVDPKSIDSRAAGGAAIPDAVLHSSSIADAIAGGRPVMVVISTPVYCMSRFCGPITDSVQALAEKYGDRMAFVHLEVWKDFDKKLVSEYAAEWIRPKGGLGDIQEPWVYVVGKDGLVKARFDNVASDATLEAAVKAQI